MQSNHIILFAKCQELIAKYLLHFYFIYKIDPILIKKQKKEKPFRARKANKEK